MCRPGGGDDLPPPQATGEPRRPGADSNVTGRPNASAAFASAAPWTITAGCTIMSALMADAIKTFTLLTARTSGGISIGYDRGGHGGRA